MIPRERAFSAPIYVFYDFFVNADSLLVLCHFGKKESTVNHGKTKQYVVCNFNITSGGIFSDLCMKRILNKQFTFSEGHMFFRQTHFIPSQPF